MLNSAQIGSLCLLALLSDATTARSILHDRDLEIPLPGKFNYTIEHPYSIPAKSNGLVVQQPNMILFMPDQLRFDSVGCFGNKVDMKLNHSHQIGLLKNV
jgi:hypothetical protein